MIIRIDRACAIRGAALLCLGWRETPAAIDGNKIPAILTYERAVEHLTGLSSTLPPAADDTSTAELGGDTLVGPGDSP